MTVYRYRALTTEGVKRRATIQSTSERAARTSLLAEGLSVTALSEKRGLGQVELVPKRVKRTDLMHFSRQLSAFLRAGIPLLEALESLADGTSSRVLAKTLLEMRDALREGDTFADVVGAQPRVFPAVYRGMVASAELTGNLDEVLDQLAGYLERDEDARREIRSAMVYPSIVIFMALATVLVLAVFVMPKFESFFDSMGGTLPAPTRALLAVTGFVGGWWWAILAGLGLIGLLLWAAARSEHGRLAIDRVLLWVPVLGDAIRYAIVERFCRTMGTMVQAGVSLPEALSVAAQGTNNRVYGDAIGGIREGMMQGEGVARPIEITGLFPTAMTQMVRAGEATGTLDDQLGTAATYFGQELRYKIKKLTGAFEPAVIVFVGLLVGFVAIALVSAMYGIFRQVGA